MNNLDQQLDFIMEIDKLKAVYRQTRVKSDDSRRENSAEHSWQIAFSAILLEEYTMEKINILRVVKMLLIHDIIEIDAGDLFAFAQDSNHKEQEIKELAACERLFSILPNNQEDEYKSLWLEFEECKSADSIFAKSIDRLLPLLINMRSEGGTWVEHKISKSQVLKRNSYLKNLSPKLWSYVEKEVNIAVENSWLLNK